MRVYPQTYLTRVSISALSSFDGKDGNLAVELILKITFCLKRYCDQRDNVIDDRSNWVNNP